MLTSARRAAAILAAAAALPASLLIGGTAAAAPQRAAHPPQYQVRVILNGAHLRHRFIPAGKKAARTEALSSPDDITVLGHDIYTTFQNGVGPQGQPSPDGNTDSTIVEFTLGGHVVRQWDLHGKCDGITADTAKHLLIATIDEDAHSSVYTITPGAPSGHQVLHYRWNHSPLPHNGGTDAISVWDNKILVSASAPGTVGKPAPQPSYPAVYSVTFDRATLVASVRPLFYDESEAIVANTGKDYGKQVRLALTDPDSSEDVPASGPRFANDFMLTSQGDKEQIFYAPGGKLAVLRLTQSVDDTAWARGPRGVLVGANTAGSTIDVVTGPFPAKSIFVAVTPCDADNAPATCPGPGFPPNYLGQLNPWTGVISKVDLRGPAFGPQGMVFIGPGWNVQPG
ncbi:MAG: hypothetical protein ABSA02_06915 [Trebonia sp.]|jgi:hypothetical protein